MAELISTQPDGNQIPLGSLAKTFTYVGDLVSTISVQYPNRLGVLTTYRKTFTYDGNLVTGITGWEVVP